MPEYDNSQRPCVAIMGIRGVPGAHGGFETFVSRLAPYLASRGWLVRVYCQEDDPLAGAAGPETVWSTSWQGVDRLHIAVGPDTPGNSIRFDWQCVSHAILHRPDAVLILGYNTAVFAARLRFAGIPTVINMDGIEYSRAKWSLPEKAWLYFNERAGCLFANHLIADHPQIEQHLRMRTKPRKITVIPYGSDLLEPPENTAQDRAVLTRHGIVSERYATLIARPEPENSILPMVRAYSAKPRGAVLLVLGNYYPKKVPYHAEVLAAAGTEVRFIGGVYDKGDVEALRRNSIFYMHGHQVGGCNPSLLEAMGAGNPVVAHDNRFNRWVVREGALYFGDQAECERAIDEFFADDEKRMHRGHMNRRRVRSVFNWSEILQSYQELLSGVSAKSTARDASMSPQRAQWRLDADSL
jgi:glycosyltransferase involved in cell wall biosynthesis